MSKVILVNGEDFNYSEIVMNYEGFEIFEKGEVLDLSSTKPHIWNDCPICDHHWMCLVEDNGSCPNCDTEYKMKTLDNGEVNIKFSFNLDRHE